jgi:hypothetical protein
MLVGCHSIYVAHSPEHCLNEDYAHVPSVKQRCRIISSSNQFEWDTHFTIHSYSSSLQLRSIPMILQLAHRVPPDILGTFLKCTCTTPGLPNFSGTAHTKNSIILCNSVHWYLRASLLHVMPSDLPNPHRKERHSTNYIYTSYACDTGRYSSSFDAQRRRWKELAGYCWGFWEECGNYADEVYTGNEEKEWD